MKMTSPTPNERVSPSLTVTFRPPATQMKNCGSGTLIDSPIHPAGRRTNWIALELMSV